MEKQEIAIKIFENRQVRTAWNEEMEEWYFSVVDVVEILTDSPRPRKYWSALKTKLKVEGSELSQSLGQLKLQSEDGKFYKTDVANTEQLFRLIQSIPSPKAEPFKLWIAQVAKERLDQLQDPELSIEQAMADYKRLGYSDSWINQRLKSIPSAKSPVCTMFALAPAIPPIGMLNIKDACMLMTIYASFIFFSLKRRKCYLSVSAPCYTAHF